ncbi:MAG: hypothetical protein WDO15_09775 [Bacteroidota bacterium]
MNYSDSLKRKSNVKFDFAEVYRTVEQYDSVQQNLPEDQRDNWIKRKLILRGIELNKRYKNNTHEFGDSFVAFFNDNFSTALFFLMPLFASLLKLLYARRDFFYSEHLVFTNLLLQISSTCRAR